MPRLALLVAVLLTVLGPARVANAVELAVAVAANFAPTLARLGPAFTAATGHVVRLTPGATGKLYAQIAQGAPFDVLLAADAETVRRLVQQGRALAGTEVTYAIGRLALYSAQPQLVDATGSVLAADNWRKLAIANPKIAPYGAAAEAVLGKLGLLDRLRPRLVVGENIAQTFQFVHSGSAQLGLVARAQLVAHPGGSSWLVPANLHAPLMHQAVVLTHAGHAESTRQSAAKTLLTWLRKPEAQAVLVAAGYDLPPQAGTAP